MTGDASDRPAFKDHFSARSADYAAFRPSYPAALADWLAEIAPGRALALDAGCGSGQFSVLLADRFARVIGTDASAAQLAHAEPRPNIRYRLAPADRSGLEPGSVDLIVVAQAVHWFDLPAFYAEVRRVARPGAVLALIAYRLSRIDGPAEAELQHLHRDILGPFWFPERPLVESGYSTLDFPFEELSPPEFTMDAHWPLDRLLGYTSTWSAAQAAERAGAGDAVLRAQAEIAEAWGPPEREQRVFWPLGLRVGRIG